MKWSSQAFAKDELMKIDEDWKSNASAVHRGDLHLGHVYIDHADDIQLTSNWP